MQTRLDQGHQTPKKGGAGEVHCQGSLPQGVAYLIFSLNNVWAKSRCCCFLRTPFGTLCPANGISYAVSRGRGGASLKAVAAISHNGAQQNANASLWLTAGNNSSRGHIDISAVRLTANLSHPVCLSLSLPLFCSLSLSICLSVCASVSETVSSSGKHLTYFASSSTKIGTDK